MKGKIELKNVVSKVLTNITTGVLMLEVGIKRVFASGSGADWITSGGTGGPLSDVTDTVKEVGSSGYTLVFTIGQICLFIFLCICGIGWMSAKNGNDVKEKKEKLLNVIIGGVFLFGASFIVELIFNIATKLNK